MCPVRMNRPCGVLGSSLPIDESPFPILQRCGQAGRNSENSVPANFTEFIFYDLGHVRGFEVAPILSVTLGRDCSPFGQGQGPILEGSSTSTLLALRNYPT